MSSHIFQFNSGKVKNERCVCVSLSVLLVLDAPIDLQHALHCCGVDMNGIVDIVCWSSGGDRRRSGVMSAVTLASIDLLPRQGLGQREVVLRSYW